MKAIVLKTNLKEALTITDKIAGVNATLPILKNIHISAEKEKLVISATNLEIAEKCTISAKIVEEGEITVEASVISQLIQSIPSERINIQTTGGNLEIQTETIKSTILTSPVDDFPIIPKVHSQKGVLKMTAEVLKEAFIAVSSATQQSDIHPELGSILIDFTIDTVVVAATDSFRLCEKTIASDFFETTIEEPFRILLPVKTAQEIIRIFQDNKEMIEIQCDENQVLFQTASKDCISRLNQGNFPEYQSIIPKAFKGEITANKGDLVSAIRTASIVSGKNNEIIFSPSDTQKSIQVKAADETHGAAEITVSAKIIGTAPETSFNAKHLLDGLKILKNEEVYMAISEENKPALLKEGNLLYIVMPVIH